MTEQKHESEDIDYKEDIDLLELARKLWGQRRKLLIWSVAGAVIGLIIGFSIPKEYTCDVKLSPELNKNKMQGNLASLASMTGMSLGSAGTTDAVSPDLYPDVVSSVPFLTSLFDVKVKTIGEDGNDKEITVEEYIKEDIRSPWWGVILGLPGKLLVALRSDDEDDATHKIDNFRLTDKEAAMVKMLQHRVQANFDLKNSVISVNVQMQDPLVSAMLADTVVSRLQTYITDYRTNKARQDLKFAIELNDEAKENYYKAQQRYASYLDHNQFMVTHSAQIERDRLENEATLAFNLYNSTAMQVQKAQALVQETTPVYAVVKPATVPVQASSPRKLLILVIFAFLGFMACSVWVLFLQSNLSKIKSRKLDTQNEK